MRYIRKTLQTGMDTVLSIVIVEYHSIGEIQRCVASLKTHVKVPYEVVVSSNSCYSAQQQEAINETPPLEGEGWGEAEAAVRWIFNERNGGFAYAMNEGLKVARGRYLAIMNSDCTLESDIDGMIRFMEDHPAIGAIAPQMRDAEGNIQDTARPYVSVPRYVWRQTKRIVRHKISVLDTQMDYSLTPSCMPRISTGARASANKGWRSSITPRCSSPIRARVVHAPIPSTPRSSSPATSSIGRSSVSSMATRQGRSASTPFNSLHTSAFIHHVSGSGAQHNANYS